MIREAVRSEQLSTPSFQASRPRSGPRPEPASRAGHSFGAVRVLADVEGEGEPEPAQPAEPAEPVPLSPEPERAPKRRPAGPRVKLPKRVRGPGSPAGTPDRIPPRVDTPVTVRVAGVQASAPVTLSVEGQGGGNGTVTIDRGASVDVSADAEVKLRGGDQTDSGKAGNLRLVAEQGSTQLGRSEPFSVAAYPTEIGFDFHAILSPLMFRGTEVWGASYDVTYESDSGVRGDLDLTKIAENVIVSSATGIFKGAENIHSNFARTTRSQRDHHATGIEDGDAATMIAAIKKAGPNASKQLSHQFYRFSCERSGVAEDLDKAPKVPTSGFKIAHKTSKSGDKYFIHVAKDGFKNHGVAAGTVDDTSGKAAEVKD